LGGGERRGGRLEKGACESRDKRVVKVSELRFRKRERRRRRAVLER
jgi:hypothetical protein